jgi:hypothetical protein
MLQHQPAEILGFESINYSITESRNKQMGAKIDITGRRFGSLTATKPTSNRNNQGGIIWECICDCGNVAYAAAHDLTKGNTHSCGCSRKKPRPNRVKYDYPGVGSRLYRIWSNMKTRCTNDHHDYRFSRYGGRGITMCELWKNDFGAFREWALANGYSDNLTIDRIDNDAGYEPGNCRWATMSEQSFNRHKKGETNG